MSDLHAVWHMDGGKSFLRSLDPTNIDIIVVAGDLENLAVTLPLLCDLFPRVVFVLGNHELYGTSKDLVWMELETLCERHSNLCWLDNNVAKIEGQRFVGSTLWFDRDPDNEKYKHLLNDFGHIENFDAWVYEENKEAKKFLADNVKQGDIVITHHLPSNKCIHPKYKNSALNRFFVSDVEQLIINKKPKYWIAGHTHGSIDTMIGETRIIVNPYGYFMQGENLSFDDHLILDAQV
jgi:Icc-related predicted phosphoesterase